MMYNKRPLQGRSYEQLYSMLPYNELKVIEKATQTDIYDLQDGILKKYASQVRSEAAKEILSRHEVYLYHREEGRDI